MKPQQALDLSPDGLIVLDADLCYIYINNAAATMLGRTDALGRTFHELFPHLKGSEIDVFYRRALSERRRGEMQLHDASCGVWYLVRATPCPQGIAVSFVDITSIRGREERAVQAEALQRSLLAHAGVGIIATDAERRITLFNDTAERMLGYRRSEVIGKLPSMLHDLEELQDRVRAYGLSGPDVLLHAMAEGNVRGLDEWTYMRKDGRKVPVSISVRSLRDASGNLIGYVGTVIDLTDRQAARRALERTRDQALQLAEAKNRFLANMSHEIRTPLNGVLGVSDILEDTPLDLHQQELVRTIRSSGTTLLRVLNDILDVSKMESGKFTVNPVPTDLGREIRETIALFRPAAEIKGLELKATGTDSLPFASIDGVRLRQILGNLISNSVKFTEKGCVSVSADVDGNFIRIKVADTGRGIAPDLQEAVFDSFVQAEGSRDSVGGTGLGLTLVRRMTELMDGRVRLESSVGVGTTISLRFPLVRVDELSPLEMVTWAEVAGMKVLVAEDNAVNAMVSRSQLQALGCVPTVVENGEAAVRAVQRDRYDIVLMDVQMPILDGHAATRRIRATGNPIRIVALTASALPDERQRCLESGMDDVLTKPFSRLQLATALAEARKG